MGGSQTCGTQYRRARERGVPDEYPLSMIYHYFYRHSATYPRQPCLHRKPTRGIPRCRADILIGRRRFAGRCTREGRRMRRRRAGGCAGRSVRHTSRSCSSLRRCRRRAKVLPADRPTADQQKAYCRQGARLHSPGTTGTKTAMTSAH